MTETSPVVAANGVDDNDPASVGRALPDGELRIGENRELQVRGPSVMKGYWMRPQYQAGAGKASPSASVRLAGIDGQA